MTEASKAGQQDQSMEDILQSIKRIIAEEGDVKPQPEAMADRLSDSPFGSDVLELTEMMEEEPSAVQEKPVAPMDPIDAIFAAPTEGGFSAPEFAQWNPDPEPGAEAMQADADEMLAEPIEKAPIAIIPSEGGMSSSDEGLLSEISVAAASAALKSLKKNAPNMAETQAALSMPAFRGGLTIEDLVIEALRPMLKEWLDANLPHIVDRKVAKEIERISNAV